MTVRMILIGGNGRYSKPTPDHQGTENVRRRLNPVSDQRIGIAEDTRNDFGDRKQGIDNDTKGGSTQT
jgi:hypothetical protein